MDNQAYTLAFDVYGTLIDTDGVLSHLESLMASEKAMQVSRTWRDKQLEYSFRRALMQSYANFEVCTMNALDYACDYHQVTLSAKGKKQLRDIYRELPAFNDVKDGLAKLNENNNRLFAFSNADKGTINDLLTCAGIRNYFEDVISVDEVKTFKPDPAVYAHFINLSGSNISNCWLVSSNPFDVIGASSFGMSTAWLRRSTNMVFDPWGIKPSIIIKDFNQLNERLI